MTGTVRVFINGRGVDVPAGASVLDAVRAIGEAEAESVASGSRGVTDSRGLPAGPDDKVYAGAIFRLVSGRRREAEPGT